MRTIPPSKNYYNLESLELHPLLQAAEFGLEFSQFLLVLLAGHLRFDFVNVDLFHDFSSLSSKSTRLSARAACRGTGLGIAGHCRPGRKCWNPTDPAVATGCLRDPQMEAGHGIDFGSVHSLPPPAIAHRRGLARRRRQSSRMSSCHPKPVCIPATAISRRASPDRGERPTTAGRTGATAGRWVRRGRDQDAVRCVSCAPQTAPDGRTANRGTGR